MADESRKELNQAPNSTLNSRLKFHMSQTSGDDDNMVSYNLLNDTSENLLCMASVHFERKNYDEAIDIYKRIIIDEKD